MAKLTGISTSRITKGAITVNFPDMEYAEYSDFNTVLENLKEQNQISLYLQDNRKNWAFNLYSVQADYINIKNAILAMNGTVVTYIPHIDSLTDSYECWISAHEDVVNSFPTRILKVSLTGKQLYVPAVAPE